MRHSSAPSRPLDRGNTHNPDPSRDTHNATQEKTNHHGTDMGVAPLPNNVWGRLNDFARWQQDPTWVPSTAPPSVLSTDRLDAPGEPSPVKRSASSERPGSYAAFFPHMQDVMLSPTVKGSPIYAETIPDSLSNTHCGDETRAEPPNPADSNLKTENRVSSLPITKYVTDKPQEAPTTPTKTTTPDVQNILQSCVRRLETLETYSFSHVPLDEVQDKFELIDGRLLEMEYWRKDIDARLEKSQLAIEDHNSQASTSFQDALSRDCTKALKSRVSDIEDRIADLETAQPSYANPWEIEVVLLPFGRTLKGVWHDSNNLDLEQLPSTPSVQYGDRRVSGGLLPSTATKEPAWNADTIEAWASTINPWLWPKAPGLSSASFKRLQSRGFVRSVSLVDSGAHGIWETIKDAFADFVGKQPLHRSNNQQQPYEALREPFVPLRKVKKSSWLRYMEPHELITPASWDISFLNSGVLMNGKGGRKRLYMTTADGYIQPGKTGWTWQRIRNLPRYENTIARSGMLFSKEAPSEPFWEYTAALDDAPSFNSFLSQSSSTSSLGKRRITFADHGEEEIMASPSAASYTSSSSSSSSANTITPRYSSSFPIITKKHRDTSQSKHRNHSPSCTPIAYQKRRRTSGSPTYRAGLLEELTPRWSHEPPTPSMENAWESRSQCVPGSRRKRLSTPTAYATPHSHNVANVVDLAMADGGDTEVESVCSGVAESENEWGGLDEDGYNHDDVAGFNSQSVHSGSVWVDDSFQQVDDADSGSLYEP
jgi:hypothetical protein